MPNDNVHDVAIIGAGIAGLTAGLFSARLGRSTLVIVHLMPGGNLATVNAIEDFPGFPQGIAGYDLGPIVQEQAAAADAEFRMGEVEQLRPSEIGWRLVAPEGNVDARAVIIATGSRIRTLGVPGEERLTGKGVSHCASCDGPLLRGKSVVVVGAGDAGLQEALVLAELAAKVTVLDRSPESSAQADYQRRVRAHGKIELVLDQAVEEILGDEAVTGVRARPNRSGDSTVFDADAVFIYGGLVPNVELVANLIELSSSGHIPTDAWMRTSRAGLFAAGDVRADSASQAITSAGDGATAAISAHRYLQQAR